MKLEMPKAVFWDWDGTLVDSYGFLNDAHNYTLKSLGLPEFKEGEYNNYFGKPREVIYPAIYKDKCDKAMVIFQEYVLKNNHKIQILQDSKDILELFYQKNITMGIVSNKKAKFIMEELKNLGLKKYFSVVVGSGDAHSDKPSGAPLLLALQKTGISDHDKKNIWYIGDTENDLSCANEVGCHSVFITGENNSLDLIKQYSPLVTFDTYRRFKEILVAI